MSEQKTESRLKTWDEAMEKTKAELVMTRDRDFSPEELKAVKSLQAWIQENRSNPSFVAAVTERHGLSDYVTEKTQDDNPDVDQKFVEKTLDHLLGAMNHVLRDTSPLASVQYIHSPKAIPKRDLIVTAQVLGFTVVVKKTDFFSNETDAKGLCVFFEPDSLLDPANDEFQFLESKKGRLVSTKKMFGVYSQGLAMPLSIVQSYGLDPQGLEVGQDLTQALRVTKYVSDEEKSQYVAKPVNGVPFPTALVPKTDEANLQSLGDVLEKIKDRRVAITIKIDGCSATFTDDGKICGRNFQWTVRDNSNAHYFDMAEKLNILEKIKGTGWQIQSEIAGPKIQKNPLGLTENKLFVFNIFDSKSNQYLPQEQVMKICDRLEFDTVPCLYKDVAVSSLPFKTVQDWLDFANKRVYAENGAPAEGIVVKTVDNDKDHPRISFKVISQVYLSKQK
jgi:RNA ligase (TIGR02306 family)